MKEHLKTNILRGSLYLYDEKWLSNSSFPYRYPSKLSQKKLTEHSKERPFSHFLPVYGNGNQGFPIKDGVYVKSVVGKLGYIFCTRKPSQLMHYWCLLHVSKISSENRSESFCITITYLRPGRGRKKKYVDYKMLTLQYVLRVFVCVCVRMCVCVCV